MTALILAARGFDAPLPIVVVGIVTGSTYGILAVGLVLIYRTNRIINFAHGEIGAFAAVVLGVAVVKYGAPYWLALPLAMAMAAGVGALVEVGVVRRLRNAPRLMSIIATLGFAQFLGAFQAVINFQAAAGSTFPQPPGLPAFNLGKLVVSPAYTGMAIPCPDCGCGADGLSLRFTRLA